MFLTIIIAFISLVGLLIVHELGHFILAKKFGVKVEEFAVGYPPRLLSKRIGETVYSLNLLPFGAFVKIAGEQKSVEDHRSFSKKPLWQRALIIFGGALSFWVLAAVLLSIVAWLGVEGITWYEAPARGLLACGELTFLIVKGLSMALVNAFRGLPTGAQMVGPVGVFSLFTEASQQGLVYFLYFISVISLHLAVINLLPIPALDGGKLLFLAIEKIKGSPVNEKVEQRITGFFFALLLVLMAWLTVKDIIGLF